MSNINIGISTHIKKDDNIWRNGIIQNVVNFALILKNSQKDYNVFIVNTSENNTLDYNIEDIDIYPINDKYKDLDILFILGSQIRDDHYNYLKIKTVK